MNDEFWEQPEKHISPTTPSEMPSGSQNPYLTLFARVEVSLSGLAEELSAVDGVKIAPFESYHITVKTLGEVPESDIETIVDCLSETIASYSTFEVTLQGVSMFPNCIYVPVVNETKLVGLHNALCHRSALTSNAYEGTSYTPHMTIGKFTESDIDDNTLSNIFEQYQDTTWGTQTIEELHLVKDTPEGSPSIFPSFTVVTDFEIPNP